MDDGQARSKRLRNRVSSSLSGEGSMLMHMLEDASSSDDRRVGSRRLSSFTLGSDGMRSMVQTSSWGSVAEGINFFGLGPMEIEGGDGDGDGDGETEVVQRLDDATFADLNFFTMENIGPAALSLPRRDSGIGQLDHEGNDTVDRHAAGAARPVDRRNGASDFVCGARGGGSHTTIPKAESMGAICVGRAGSSQGVQGIGDVKNIGSADGGVSQIRQAGVFDPCGRPPTFSPSMEEYLNQQLEAAEKTLQGATGMEHAWGRSAHGRFKGDNEPREFVTRVYPSSSRISGSSSSRNTESDDHNRLQGSLCERRVPARGRAKAGGDHAFSTVKLESCSVGESPQWQCDSEGDAGNSDSEYAPLPAKQHKEAGKNRNGKRPARGKAAHVATITDTMAAARIPNSNGKGYMTQAGRGLSGASPSGSIPKRQTSEDVAARLPLEVLESLYHVPLNVAAQELNVSLTMLKKLCRAYGVKRWPHRQVSSLDKTISRLEGKIKAREDGGKDAPSLVRKLRQGKKRRSVIIKTASAGLEVDVLNTIFTCRPGAIDEDLLLASSDVATLIKKIKPSKRAGSKDCDSGEDEESDEDDGDDGGHVTSYSGAEQRSCRKLPSRSSTTISAPRATTVPMPAGFSRPSSSSPVLAMTQEHPPAFEPGERTKEIAHKRNTKMVGKKVFERGPTDTHPLLASGRNLNKRGSKVSSKSEEKSDGAGTVSATTPNTEVAGASASTVAAGIPWGAPATAAPAVALAASQGKFDSSADGSLTSLAVDSKSAYPSPSLSLSVHPKGRRPIASYSGMFGTRLQHTPSSVDSVGVDGGERGSVFSAARISGGGPLASESVPRKAAVRRTGGHGQGIRMSGWCGGAGENQQRSISERERGDLSMSGVEGCPSSEQQQQSDASAPHIDPPTITTTLNSFDTQLRLDSPAGQLLSCKSSAPTPPRSHHTYLLQQQFAQPHSDGFRPGFHNLHWTAGGYPGGPQQPFGFPARGSPQPFGFPVDEVPPLPDVCCPRDLDRGPGGADSIPRVIDDGDIKNRNDPNVIGGADGSTTHGKNGDGGAGGKISGGGGARRETFASMDRSAARSGGAKGAGSTVGDHSGKAEKPAAGAPPPKNSRGVPKRTGFMSFLLHQSPQGPPLPSAPSPSVASET